MKLKHTWLAGILVIKDRKNGVVDCYTSLGGHREILERYLQDRLHAALYPSLHTVAPLVGSCVETSTVIRLRDSTIGNITITPAGVLVIDGARYEPRHERGRWEMTVMGVTGDGQRPIDAAIDAARDLMIKEAGLEARRPRPPEELVGALQDRVHVEKGKLLSATPIRCKRQE